MRYWVIALSIAAGMIALGIAAGIALAFGPLVGLILLTILWGIVEIVHWIRNRSKGS